MAEKSFSSALAKQNDGGSTSIKICFCFSKRFRLDHKIQNLMNEVISWLKIPNKEDGRSVVAVGHFHQ